MRESRFLRGIEIIGISRLFKQDEQLRSFDEIFNGAQTDEELKRMKLDGIEIGPITLKWIDYVNFDIFQLELDWLKVIGELRKTL